MIGRGAMNCVSFFLPLLYPSGKRWKKATLADDNLFEISVSHFYQIHTSGIQAENTTCLAVVFIIGDTLTEHIVYFDTHSFGMIHKYLILKTINI